MRRMLTRAAYWMLPWFAALALPGCWVPHCEAFPEHCVGLDEAESSGSESTGSESGGSTSESTESTSETTSSGCTQDSECDANMGTPFCVDGACVGCGEAGPTACVDANPSLPVCDVGSGACVQCLAGGDVSACEGTTPVCDGETNTCVGCKWHEECPETACRMATGECFAGDVIDVGDATQIDDAIEIIQAGTGMGVIYLQASSTTNSVTVPAGVVVAILGDGQSSSQWQGNNGSSGLTVAAGAEVYVQGVRIAATPNSWGILSSGGLWIDRSAVVNNYGGVGVATGSVVIRNSFVGGDTLDVAAINVQGGTANISFTTLGAGFGVSTALLCANGSSVTVTNSLLVSRGTDDVVQCPNADITLSAIEQQQVGDNVMLGALDTAWFTNYAASDFHLSGTHPAEIETAASWQPGDPLVDPLVDIDGDPRPQDASPTAAGADLP